MLNPIPLKQKRWIRARQARFPELTPLIKRLEKLERGSLVAPVFERDLDKLIDRGKVVTAPARVLQLVASRCHENVACLSACSPKQIAIQVGWALSDDGLWRQHSWGFDTKHQKIIETTVLRTKYYGITLESAEAAEFRLLNEPAFCPCHLIRQELV